MSDVVTFGIVKCGWYLRTLFKEHHAKSKPETLLFLFFRKDFYVSSGWLLLIWYPVSKGLQRFSKGYRNDSLQIKLEISDSNGFENLYFKRCRLAENSKIHHNLLKVNKSNTISPSIDHQSALEGQQGFNLAEYPTEHQPHHLSIKISETSL